MPKPPVLKPEQFTMPLLMNGLAGRMLQLPATKPSKREILVIYGQHASLEYWWPLARELHMYGNVTMPDLPGFGGMQSFYRIHDKPTLDNLADYLAAFVKLRYKSKRLTIVGLAYGFAVVTRMLQRYPDLAKKVDVVIGFSGVARYDDILFSRPKRLLYRVGARLLATYLPALIVRHIVLRPLTLTSWYARQNEPPANITEQVALWRQNDTRTHLMALSELMKLDNCKQRVELPLWHVAMHANKSLDSERINQHLHVIYGQVEEIRSRLKSQSIGTIDYNPSATQLLPAKLKRALSY